MSTDADKYKFLTGLFHCEHGITIPSKCSSWFNNFVSFKKRTNEVGLTEFTLCFTG